MCLLLQLLYTRDSSKWLTLCPILLIFAPLAADLKVFWEILHPFLPWSSNMIYSSAPLVQKGGGETNFPDRTYMKLWSLEVMMISSSSSTASSVIVLTPDLSSSSSFPFGRIWSTQWHGTFWMVYYYSGLYYMANSTFNLLTWWCVSQAERLFASAFRWIL
jgi:hypothetical protein